MDFHINSYASFRNLLMAMFLICSTAYGQNINVPNIQGPHGVAVNSRTGNLFYKRNDLFIRGTGLSIDVAFSYNSFQRGNDYGYGKGWTFPYGMSYRPDSLGIFVYQADGRKDFYILQSGQYVSPSGIFDSWTQTQPGVFKLETKHGMEYFFEDSTHKKVTKIREPRGNELILSYTSGELQTITNSSGRSLSFSWANDHLTSITDNNVSPSRTYSFQYVNDRLVKVTNPIGDEEEYQYDQFGNLSLVLDYRGIPVQVLYHGNYQVKEVISCESHQQITYNPAIGDGQTYDQTFLIERNSSGNQVTSYIFDEAGNVMERSGSCCGTDADFEYDASKNPTKFTDGMGEVYARTFDAQGNLLSETDPLGNTTLYTYESTFNRVSSVTDPAGRVTQMTYDAFGFLTQLNLPNGNTEQYIYDSNGRLTSMTNAGGIITSYAHDVQGNQISGTYPAGTETYTYDGLGNKLTHTDLNGLTYTYTYDKLDRITHIQDPLGHMVVKEYDAKGNMTKLTDEEGNVVDYTYDGLDRLSGVTNPVGSYSYAYDASGNLSNIIDANGNETRYTYTDRNLIASTTDPEGNTISYTYDSNENLISMIDPKGQTIDYTYDQLNRLTSRSYSGNTDNYSYDAVGNLVTANNNDISLSYSYDNLNRPISKNVATWGKSISYTYDVKGNLETMTDPDGGISQYVYDNMDRLASLTNPSGLMTSFIYDSGGRLIQQDNANGTYSTYQYDNRDQLLRLDNLKSNGDTVSFFAYTYDQVGNRLTMTDQTGTHHYSYDDAYRVDSVVYSNGATEVYTFDGHGNRIQMTRDGIVTNYTYDKADRIQTAGATNFDFDANGNMILKVEGSDSTMYEYDGLNRLVKVTLPSGADVDFGYDPMGERISQKDTAGVITKYFWDQGNVLTEMNSANQTQVRYTSGTVLDSWLIMKRGGNNYQYHKDGLGSITELTNASAIIENTYQYWIFGELKSGSSNIENILLYTGREYLTQFDTYFYRSRFYDSKFGRFLTKDTYGGSSRFPFSLHDYNYVHGNPMKYSDPSGKIALKPLLGIIGASLFFYFIYDAISPTLKQTDVAREAALAVKEAVEEENFENIDELDVNRIDQWIRLGGQGAVGIANLTGGPIGSPPPISQADWAASGFYALILSIMISNAEEAEEDNDGDQDDSDDPDPDDDDEWEIDRLHAVDPNDIIGPQGYGEERWVSVKDRLPYTIRFENDPDFATAPAQKVIITHPLDDDINQFSFRVGTFGFGDFVFNPPANSSFYTDRLDVVDSLGVFVDITAGVDVNNNEAFWIFESIDPATGLATTVPPELGFLPVNDTSINRFNDTLPKVGEGYVSFSVVPKNTSLTGDSIHAEAFIVFDFNAPIETNVEINIIDAFPPTSVVDTLPSFVDSTFMMTVTVADDSGGCGVSDYDLYVSEDGAPFYLFETEIRADTPYLFIGDPGLNYCLYTRARDNVKNLEANKTEADRCVGINEEGSVTILADLSGSTFCPGDSALIQWEANQVDSVNLYVGETVSGPFYLIADQYPTADSNYLWVIPDTLPSGSGFVLKIEASKDSNVVDFSDGTFTINSLPDQPVIAASGPTILCQGFTVDLSAPTGFSQYLWSNGDTTQTLTADQSADYSVVVTDANGCKSIPSQIVQVQVNPLPPQPIVGTSGPVTFCDGDSVTLDGPSGYTYNWSDGSQNQNLTVNYTGIFTLTVQDSNLCESPVSLPISVVVNPNPAAPLVAANGSTTFCDGDSVQLSASGIYNSYLWSDSSMDSVLWVSQSGNYSLQVENNFGCQSTSSTDVGVTVNPLPAQPTVNVVGALQFCEGDSVVLSGPVGYTYLWSSGDTTQSIAVNQSSTLDLVIIDGNSCQSPVSAPVVVVVDTLPAQPQILASGSTAICEGDSVVLSGPAGYNYIWSTGDTTETLVVSDSGLFTLSVIDGNMCESSVSSVVSVSLNPLPPIPSVMVTGNTAFCDGDSVVLSGPSGYEYIWSTGDTIVSISIESGGNYTLAVIDSNGCVSSPSSAIDVVVNPLPMVPTITAQGSLDFCLGDSANLVGPAGFDSYVWSTGDSISSIWVSTSGTITLAVTDSNQCQSPASVPVMVTVEAYPSQPMIDTLGSTTFCEGDSVTLQGPVGYQYLWSTGDTSQALSVNTSGAFALTVLSSAGCESPVSDSLFTTVVPLPANPVISDGDAVICEGDSVLLSSSTADRYFWNTGDTTQAIWVMTTGIYSVEVEDAIGCRSSGADSVSVQVNMIPAKPDVLVLDSDTLMASTVAAKYEWYLNGILLPDTTQKIVVTQSGTYSVIAINESCNSLESEAVAVTATDIDQLFGGGSIRIYPNPSAGIVVVDGEFLQVKTVTLRIFDARGRELTKTVVDITGGILFEKIDLTDQAEGNYFIMLESGGEWLKKKIAITR